MAGRLLLPCLRQVNGMSVRSYCHLKGPPVNVKIGKREIVGHGLNGTPCYIDLEDFPLPAIRFKEVTPDIQVLKDKEKGDWKKLSIDEKKALYRASFRQTFAELNAPTGEWKSVLGSTLIGISIALWFFMFFKFFVYPPLPESMKEENILAQYERMVKLRVDPITGLTKDM